MDVLVRASSRWQTWFLRRPGLLSRLALTAFYSVEVILYTATGPTDFLERRQKLLGPNFAALGRLIVGEHAATSELLASPQRRGPYAARGRITPRRMPQDFPLFQHDQEVGGDGQHEVLHRWLFEQWLEPARGRLHDPRLEAIVDEGVTALAELEGPLTEPVVRPAVNRMVARYMLLALLELEPSEEQLQAIIDMAYSEARLDNYLASAATPMLPPDFLVRRLQQRTAEIAALMGNSPLFEDWTPGPDNNHMSRDRLGELLLSLVIIAALGGTGNLVVNMLVAAEEPLDVDLTDDKALLGVVLEAARIKPPVNHVNTVLAAAKSFDVEGTPLEFPEGTVVAASLGGAHLNAGVFPNPRTFDPHRDNLERDVLSFNAVGFHPEPRPDARRVCPGRNVAVQFAKGFYVKWRARRG